MIQGIERHMADEFVREKQASMRVLEADMNASGEKLVIDCHTSAEIIL